MTDERRLVSMRRRVTADRQAAYRAIWEALAAAAGSQGAHAWRFDSPDDADLRLEFLEFRASADPRRSAEIRTLLRRLDVEVAGAVAEEWLQGR